ncbi:FAD-binding oxidoreductase [Microbacterium sp. LTA6]|uniref:FAD-binding oxidoreductase n=1 Tax=unclassified Microbacterium TaxID=2609290 RepID=UPI00313A1A28
MLAEIDTQLAEFTGAIITPDSAEYSAAARTPMASAAPVLVLRPADTADVARAVRFAAASDLPLAVRGGGHSAAGFSTVDGGIVIDLRSLDAVEVLPDRRVRVGGGALWRQVVEALAPHGLVISSGDTADVGVGGLTLSGGIGWMVRRDGLTLDHLRAVELVTASGDVLVVDAEHHAELFWALRGGGGAYGVVTAFEFEAQATRTVEFAALTFSSDQAERIVTGWAAHMRHAPHAIGSTVVLANPLAGGKEAPIVVTMVRSDEGDLVESVDALRAIAAPLSVDARRRTYAEILHPGAELPLGLRAVVRNGFVAPDAADAAALAVARIAGESQPSAIVLHSLGGAFAEVPADATAFAHRYAELMVTTFAVGPDAAVGGIHARMTEVWRDLEPHVAGAYANSLDGSSADAVASIYPEGTRERLAAVKAAYDSADLFSRNFGARPASTGAERGQD